MEFFCSAAWCGCAAENNPRMSSKSTWLWMTVAAVLFAFIFIFGHYFKQPEPGPKYLLPGLDARAVTTVEIQPASQLGIRVERTNGSWQLEEPIVYPAQSDSVRKLLDTFQKLMVAHSIPEEELKRDANTDENYGLEPPQMSVVLRGETSTSRINFGRRTAPGDQVFVSIIGIDGISVVDADILNLFPTNADAWRETALIDFARIAFDRITVTNAARNPAVQLQRQPINKLWEMTVPIPARADNDKVEAALQALDKLQVRQFLPNDPKADLDTFGLQNPNLTIALGEGTNTLVTLDFGRESTNSPGLIYARRSDQNAIVAVGTNALGPWRGSYELFRDRHLVRLAGPLDAIEVQGQDKFSLKWQTNNSWRVMPQDFPADANLSAGLAVTLSEMQIADFEKDSVLPSDLPQFGLAPPARTFTLTWTDVSGSTNPPVELDFGTNKSGKVFAQRAGEKAVYDITPADFEKLPDTSWQMRDRKIWDFDINDVSRVIVRQNGQTREMIRNGTNGWSLAPGSQGSIIDAAVEDTTGELGHLAAFSWAGRGAQNLANFGFIPQGYQLSIELKSGEKQTVQFGRLARFGAPYASVMLKNEPWIFEFPPDVYQDVRYCLTIPPAP